MTNVCIPFIDLKAQQELIRTSVDSAIAKVLDHGRYIMGPEIIELETQLASFSQSEHAISCSNGTDALLLAILALGAKAGDCVFVPSFTFAATAEVIALVGATPVFVDSLPDTFNIDPQSLKQAIQTAKNLGLHPRGIIGVDLFGQPADYLSLKEIADENKMWLIEDAAQSFGATFDKEPVGTYADVTTTSFFPAKPLGCYGDGGCVLTNDDELAEVIKSLRVHGKGTHKYDNVRIGINGRLDTMQAAVVLEKLKIFPQEIIARQKTADFYSAHLQESFITPALDKRATSTWAQYTLRLPKTVNRDKLMQYLKEAGIPTVVYYPNPLHNQTAYKNFPRADINLSVCDELSKDVLSLPMSGYVKSEHATYIVEKLKEYSKELVTA